MKRGLASNPFSVQRLGPLGIDYLFESEQDRATFFHRLAGNNWWMELLGPHGVGKSTLMTTIEREAASRAIATVRFRLRTEHRRLPFRWRRMLAGVTLCLLDGGEAALSWQRSALVRYCRSHGIGLILTTHRPLGIASVYTVTPTARMLRLAIEELLGPNHPWLTELDFEALVNEHRGDVRELMYHLYQRCESSGVTATVAS